jgi:hypothetical protein
MAIVILLLDSVFVTLDTKVMTAQWHKLFYNNNNIFTVLITVVTKEVVILQLVNVFAIIYLLV